MTSTEPSLAGARILVCRPEPKASALCLDLQRLGADARALPMIVIEPAQETPQSRTLIQDFDQFDCIVVVSPIAADLLLTLLDAWWPQLPAGQTWYAIGPGTARRLQQAGIDCHAPEQGHDSESLLETPALQHLNDQKILICAGEGGRPLLADTFRERGARVEKLALYRRRAPDYSPAQIDQALVQFNPDALVILSGETLNNLLALSQNADRQLFQRLLIVPTERIAQQARAVGFSRCIVPDRLDNPALALQLTKALCGG